MRAVTVMPGRPRSQRLEEIGEPSDGQGAILVRALAVGICGTDRELISLGYGEAGPGHERLVIGHESLGRAILAPPSSDFTTGDIVDGIVRHPDSVDALTCPLEFRDM